MRKPLRLQWILDKQETDSVDVGARAKRVAHRIVRLSWLAVMLVLDGPPSYADYHRRFGVSRYTFYRDKRKLRRTAMYIDSFVYGKYRTLGYLMDTSDE